MRIIHCTGVAFEIIRIKSTEVGNCRLFLSNFKHKHTKRLNRSRTHSLEQRYNFLSSVIISYLLTAVFDARLMRLIKSFIYSFIV